MVMRSAERRRSAFVNRSSASYGSLLLVVHHHAHRGAVEVVELAAADRHDEGGDGGAGEHEGQGENDQQDGQWSLPSVGAS